MSGKCPRYVYASQIFAPKDTPEDCCTCRGLERYLYVGLSALICAGNQNAVNL